MSRPLARTVDVAVVDLPLPHFRESEPQKGDLGVFAARHSHN